MIHAVDQNPAGSDKANKWVTLYNPSNESVDTGNWILETADGERENIPWHYPLSLRFLCLHPTPYQWLDNSEEAITLSDSKREEVAKMPKSKGNYYSRSN